MTEAELRPFFVGLVERHASRSTLVVYRSGIRFLVESTLGHRWPVFDLLRPAKGHTLPVVLSPAEVRTGVCRGDSATRHDARPAPSPHRATSRALPDPEQRVLRRAT